MLREDIALIVCEDRNAIEAFDNGEPVNIPSCNDRADQILNLKIGRFTLRELEEKADRVAILAENQGTPQYNLDFLSSFDADRAQSNFTDVLHDFGKRIIKDMLKANFKSVEG